MCCSERSADGTEVHHSLGSQDKIQMLHQISIVSSNHHVLALFCGPRPDNEWGKDICPPLVTEPSSSWPVREHASPIFATVPQSVLVASGHQQQQPSHHRSQSLITFLANWGGVCPVCMYVMQTSRPSLPLSQSISEHLFACLAAAANWGQLQRQNSHWPSDEAGIAQQAKQTVSKSTLELCCTTFHCSSLGQLNSRSQSVSLIAVLTNLNLCRPLLCSVAAVIYCSLFIVFLSLSTASSSNRSAKRFQLWFNYSCVVSITNEPNNWLWLWCVCVLTSWPVGKTILQFAFLANDQVCKSLKVH